MQNEIPNPPSESDARPTIKDRKHTSELILAIHSAASSPFQSLLLGKTIGRTEISDKWPQKFFSLTNNQVSYLAYIYISAIFLNTFIYPIFFKKNNFTQHCKQNFKNKTFKINHEALKDKDKRNENT